MDPTRDAMRYAIQLSYWANDGDAVLANVNAARRAAGIGWAATRDHAHCIYLGGFRRTQPERLQAALLGMLDTQPPGE